MFFNELGQNINISDPPPYKILKIIILILNIMLHSSFLCIIFFLINIIVIKKLNNTQLKTIFIRHTI